MKNTLLKLSFSLVILFFLSYAFTIKADCLTCDGQTDTGICNRSGVKKTCVMATGNQEKDCDQSASAVSKCPVTPL